MDQHLCFDSKLFGTGFVIVIASLFFFKLLTHGTKTILFAICFNFKDSLVMPQNQFLSINQCLLTHSLIEVSYCYELVLIYCLMSGCVLFISLKGSMLSMF